MRIHTGNHKNKQKQCRSGKSLIGFVMAMILLCSSLLTGLPVSAAETEAAGQELYGEESVPVEAENVLMESQPVEPENSLVESASVEAENTPMESAPVEAENTPMESQPVEAENTPMESQTAGAENTPMESRTVEAENTPAESQPVESETSDGQPEAAEQVSAETESAQPFVSAVSPLVYAGDGYTVKVSFTEAAGIPEGAYLVAQPLAEEDADYEEYKAQALGAVDASMSGNGTAAETVLLGLFDLTIYDAEGFVIEPQAPVTVTASVGGTADAASGELYAVHFVGSGAVNGDAGTYETITDAAVPMAVPDAEPDAVPAAKPAAEFLAAALERIEVIAAGNAGGEMIFETGSFSVYALVSTTMIETTVLASDGNNYHISVTCGPEAGIPEGAALDVREILEGDEEYAAHMAGTAEAIGKSEETITYVRMFDIQILSEEGEKLEPAAPVQVTIGYEGPAAEDAGEEGTIQVVHFGEEQTEVITPETAAAEDGSSEEVSFEATSFSVYSIVYSGATENLDGKSFAMITATTGGALQAAQQPKNKNRLAAQNVDIASNYITSSQPVTMWTFQAAGNTGNQYYIQADTGKYLNVSNDTVTVSNTPQALTVQTDSHRPQSIRIWNESRKMAVSNIDGNNSTGFGVNTKNDSNEWFTLYKMNEVVLVPAPDYAAEKISVQDLEDAQRVVIYKTVFNELAGKFEDYILDGNGNPVRAYDKGDQVVGQCESPVWVVTFGRDDNDEYNGYYIFRNTETGLCLCPQEDGTLVAAYESDKTSGVTLNGRRDGKYISTIEKWDSSAWAWYGYRITEDDEQEAMKLESATGTESQEFSFAEYISKTTNELHPVATVDSTLAGITIHMFDYPDRNTIASVTGSNTYAERELPDPHVKATLKNGYPVFTNGKSGAALFQPGNTYDKGTGNHLFLESVYNSTGYYEYSAFNNFAHYDQKTGNFTVYQETGTPSNTNKFYFQRGNFFPFNDLTVKNKATNQNLYDGSGYHLDPVDPSREGTLYMIQNPDFYFGMTMEATFMQAKDGLLKGSPVVYEFNGDDDLWIYVDDVLILDIGGVHDAWPGSINFATGEIIGGNSGAGGARTIRDCFKNAGIFPDGTRWDDSRADEYFKGNTFVDYGSHTFKMFYMEHGAGASNLEMHFNLPVIEKGRFTVEKELIGTDQQKYANVYFAYQAFEKDDKGNDVPLTSAVYEGTQNPVRFYDAVEINGKTYNHVFYLKPGEAATFAEMAEDVEYYVQELGVGSDYYDQITVNDVQISGIDATPIDGIYPTSVATVGNRARVNYANRCSEKNLNDLRITKKLADGSADDGTTFEFRVLLENADGVLAPYSTGEYYLQNEEGDYFRYANGKLVNNGKTPVVASVAGNNGTIAGIPAGYTVVIRNLLAGTDFHVEEIRIPSGWKLEGKAAAENSFDPSDLIGRDFAGKDVPADGQIRLNTDAQMTFTNKPEKKLVVNKKDEKGNSLKGTTFTLLQSDRQTAVAGYETIVSDDKENGNLIAGVHLPNGTYYLKETETIDGYMLLSYMLKITVTEEGITMETDPVSDMTFADETKEDTETFTFTVVNTAGKPLPLTGGPGTRGFLMAGGMLAAGAALLLWRRRRDYGR